MHEQEHVPQHRNAVSKHPVSRLRPRSCASWPSRPRRDMLKQGFPFEFRDVWHSVRKLSERGMVRDCAGFPPHFSTTHTRARARAHTRTRTHTAQGEAPCGRPHTACRASGTRHVAGRRCTRVCAALAHRGRREVGPRGVRGQRDFF